MKTICEHCGSMLMLSTPGAQRTENERFFDIAMADKEWVNENTKEISVIFNEVIELQRRHRRKITDIHVEAEAKIKFYKEQINIINEDFFHQIAKMHKERRIENGFPK